MKGESILPSLPEAHSGDNRLNIRRIAMAKVLAMQTKKPVLLKETGFPHDGKSEECWFRRREEPDRNVLQAD